MLKSIKICLNMIVKNEGIIIERLLNSVVNIISGCIITDTGSTDNTKEIIKNFCDKNNLFCELKDEEFRNFEYARNKSLEHAQNSNIEFDYILLLDADHQLIIDKNFKFEELIEPVYLLNQGTDSFSYCNVRLIKKNIKAKYIGCTHEYLSHNNHTTFLSTLSINDIGDGGSKTDKFARDIKLLEEGIKNEPNNSRYYFYLGNSYRDNNQPDKAISSYEMLLKIDGWVQEKFYSCLRLFECYSKIGNIEKGLYYLTISYQYDNERPECIYELVKYYCAKKLDLLAMKYYELIKDNYEKNILLTKFENKLFIDLSIAYFYLPYYIIIAGIRVEDWDTVAFMYEIIFRKKQKGIDKWWINNLLYNYQFIVDKLQDDFEDLFDSYIDFLKEYNYDVEIYDKNKKKVNIKNYKNNIININKDEKYKKSKKILFYVGHSLPDYKWNKSMSLSGSMGGSEKALSYLIDQFPNDYEIYVCGDVIEETINNIRFLGLDKIDELLKYNNFHTIIMSRYIEFLVNYKFNCYKLYIWAHDTILRSLNHYNKNLNELLSLYDNFIDGCICLTQWHKYLFINIYPSLKDKIYIINNGIPIEKFPKPVNKIKNSFIYSSRSERGLKKVLELWENINLILPDATLKIASYKPFPDLNSQEDLDIQISIKKYNNITHLGKLNTKELYDLMNESEYWLYPTNYYETSCITAMEMLKSRVICLYYPLAGLTDTMNNNGIKLIKDQEINQIIELTSEKKEKLIIEGEKYADSCCWNIRYKEWEKLLFL